MTATITRKSTISCKSHHQHPLTSARARKLLQTEIEFISNRSFKLEQQATPDEFDVVSARSDRDKNLPAGLPGHLARLCQSSLLTAEEETRLFRRMNYVKFQAEAIRSRLDPEQADVDAMEQVDQLLAEAKKLRDRIVQANMRLVISVVKRFVTPQQSFDDLLSDGIFSLMQAVNKFDYDRGFRFSTYAYRAIARNTLRKINDAHTKAARHTANSEDAAFDVMDERGSSSMQDAAWEKLRQLLGKFLEQLDRRERFIIRSRYALGAHRKVRTFQFLADKLGVSKERVRQLERRAVGKLKSFAASHATDELVGPAFI